jgi:protein tyrosine/serine phosphatase
MDFHEILPELVLGDGPYRPDDIRTLQQEDITAVLNLQTDDELATAGVAWSSWRARCQEAGLEVQRVRVRAAHRRALRAALPACVQTLAALLDAGHAVYVHCSTDAQRSATVVVCYLYWSRGWCVGEAERFVRRQHPCSPDMEAVRLATRDRRRPQA